MKKEVMRTVLVCDWCGSEEEVRTYTFRRWYSDEHGKTQKEDVDIELCERCQHFAYKDLSNISKKRKDYE